MVVKLIEQLSPVVRMMVTILGTVGSILVFGSFYVGNIEHAIERNTAQITLVGEKQEKLNEQRERDKNSFTDIKIEQRVLQSTVEQEKERAEEFRRRTDDSLKRIIRKLDGEKR